MKKSKSAEKLALHKQTLVQLDKGEMNQIKGGSTTGGCTSPTRTTRQAEKYVKPTTNL
jgi:natural product precursor